MTTAVEVTYTNFKVKEGVDAGDIKKLMCRDASWGTHIDILHAAQKNMWGNVTQEMAKY